MSRALGRGASGRRPAITAEELDARCTGLGRAVRVADGRLDPAAVRLAGDVVARAAQRRGLSPDLTVVALAGSTGGGKSTLFNRLVGEDLAPAGVLRPTTGEPLAALWTPPAPAGGLLGWLGVRRWHAVDAAGSDPDLTGLVLLDLPDHDSTAAQHREQVDRLLERVDVMVWVLDPQKYADALVHDEYLRRHARHAEVTVVLLNQVDTLSDADARACLADLRRLLDLDGLGGARVLALSARTGSGVPELEALLAEAVQQRRAALTRLAGDVATAADALRAAAGDASTSIHPVPPRITSRLEEALADAAGVGLVEQAVRRSVQLRGRRRTGWPVLRWVHALRRDPVQGLRLGRPGVAGELVRTSLPSASPVAIAGVSEAAREYAASASAGAPEAWVRSARAVATAAVEGIGPELDAAVARAEVSSPRDPRWWTAVRALHWALLATAVTGGLWLLALAGMAALALAPPEPPVTGGLPVPTVMLVTGCLAGIILAGLAGAGARRTARHAGRRARDAVTAQVAEVARRRITEPVSAELATLAEFRVGLVAALGG